MTIEVQAERYRYGDLAGMRGVKIEAETGMRPGGFFSQHMETVFVSDCGDVECGEIRVPRRVFREWLSATLEALEAIPDDRSPVLLTRME